MTKILFVCHGNICRSPMAEFVMKDLVQKQQREADFCIESAATSTEELGHPVHPGTARKLREAGISCRGKAARQLKPADYDDFDYLIGMDGYNLHNMQHMLGGDPEGKLHKLLSFCGEEGDVADPWYTGDFDTTWQDVLRGCRALYKTILRKEEALPCQR